MAPSPSDTAAPNGADPESIEPGKTSPEVVAQLRRAARSFLDQSIFVDGREYRYGDLTYGELETLEDFFGGRSVTDLDLSSARVQMILVWLIRRRRDPEYDLDEVRKLTLDEMMEVTTDPKIAEADAEAEAESTSSSGGRKPATRKKPPARKKG